ncbi:MAG: folylpolyglutamate synthase/dihydrofolate synthase family protein, partial [Phormidesmis sp.]
SHRYLPNSLFIFRLLWNAVENNLMPQSNLSIQSAVEADLESFARFGVDLSLDRIEKLLADLGNPHEQVPMIHVAGTNGKGSVCAYLASVLKAAGYRTGRYTSPHLVNWTERICIDGVPISWTDLQIHLDTVKAAINHLDPTPTQFEVFTAAAWLYFAQQQVEVAVVEVGLGGRLDATNVWQKPLATVIVSISRDHWQRLGDTIAEIAGEKAGILKPDVTAIAGPLPPEAQAVVAARATEVGAPLTWIVPAKAAAVSSAGSLPELIYNGVHYPQALLGDHQRINSACAIATLQTLRTQGWAISDETIAKGMAQVQWPGRLQKGRWQGHHLLIDGAHNQAAAKSLRAYIDQAFANQPITWLMGMLSTKDHAGVFAELLRAGDRLHLVPVPGHLSAQADELEAIAQHSCPALASTKVHNDLAAGLAAATQTAPVVLCGSLYLIGYFYEHHGS